MSPIPSPSAVPSDGDDLASLHPLFRTPTWTALARVDRSVREQRRAVGSARAVTSPRGALPGPAVGSARQVVPPVPRGGHRLAGKTGSFSRDEECFTGYVVAVSSDDRTMRAWSAEGERLRILNAEVWTFTPDGGTVG